MTNINITFTSNNTISIENATGVDITVYITNLSSAGIYDVVATLTIGIGITTSYTFTVDGFYRLTKSAEATTIIIAANILTELEKDVKEILLSDDVNKILPKGYDFVSLVLLSLMFIGNNTYQLADYNSDNDSLYTVIATAIDNCKKYLDRQENTVQSTNKIWQ